MKHISEYLKNKDKVFTDYAKGYISIEEARKALNIIEGKNLVDINEKKNG